MSLKFDPQANTQVLTITKDKGTFIIMSLGTASYAVDFSYWLPSPHTHVMVGNYCSLARQICFNIGRNHNFKNVTTYPRGQIEKILQKKIKSSSGYYKNPFQIIIGHDVWIGQGVTIMGGVKIGNGAVIGANAVVAKDIPPYAIAVGNPARVIKYRFDETTIRKLLAVKWWNWSLEKIADNFPLLNDVEKFLGANYLPALEEFPEDEFTQKLNNFAGGGQAIYQFIPDFEAKNPLWLKVVQDFKQENLSDGTLVIWLGKDATEENLRSLTEAIGDNKNIITFKHDKSFSPAALRKATHFITTREMSTLEALDYLWNTDIKIISALDNNIFGG